MRHLRRIKCIHCGTPPTDDEPICHVCSNSEWIWHCERHGLPAQEDTGCERCSYHFDGRRYAHESELASALAAKWDAALAKMKTSPLEIWVEDGLGNPLLARSLRQWAVAASGFADAALAGMLVALDPQVSLKWRGRDLLREDFVTKGEPSEYKLFRIACEIFESNLPEWFRDTPCGLWLVELSMQCRRRATVLGMGSISEANPLQWWWLLAEGDALQAATEKVKKHHVTSRDHRIAQLFNKKELTDTEAVMLGAAAPDQLLTVETAWHELVQLTLPTISDLEGRARQRPCTKQELNSVKRELGETVTLLRKQREELRPRQANLPELPELIEATAAVQAALRQAIAAHDSAHTTVREIRELVERGHIRRAVSAAVEARLKTACFPDLTLDFVTAAEIKFHRRRRLFLKAGMLLTIVMVVALIIIKIFSQLQPTPL